MKKIFYFIVPALLTFAACKKDTPLQPPVISFKTGNAYTQNNAVVAVGHSIYFGVQARGNSGELTNFTIKKRLPDGNTITMYDTATYTNFIDIDKVFYQNVETQATWLFSVQDRNRMSAEISLVVNKDPNSQFGGIYYFPSIKMGFQDNTQYPHFLNPTSGSLFDFDSAGAHQSEIDILCYFLPNDNPPSPTISSPGEMDNFSTDAVTYYPIISGWTTRNYTLWDISVDANPIPVSAFDNAQNDSLLIVSYDEVWGRKKFRWANTGRVIPFKTGAGKLGLIKVLHSSLSNDGYMEFSLKIQQ